MLNKIKEKIKQGWEWVKRQGKKILTILGIGAVALASTLLTNEKGIPFILVNGERIEFAYTDDNSGENLIIRTDKEIYKGEGSADVYVMVENKSGSSQTIALQSLFNDNLKTAKNISILKKTVPYQIEVNNYGTTTYDCSYVATSTGETIQKTCEKEIVVSTSTETRYKDEWQGKVISTISKENLASLIISKNISIKDTKNYLTDKIIDFPLTANEVVYLKIRIEFPRYSEGEFFVETIGSDGGYGHLDPWYEESYTSARQATANPGFTFGSINSGTYANTLTSNDSRLILNDDASAGTASSSLKYTGLGQSTLEAPYDDNAWTSPTNIYSDNAVYSSVTATTYDTNDYTYLLKATTFGFAIPSGVTINGIKVEMECYNDSGETGKDVVFQLTKNGTARVGTNKATNANWATSPTIITYGGSADLWGTTWTPTEINASTFGIHMVNQATAENADIYVDYIRITIYFTSPSVDTYKSDFNFNGVTPTDQWGDYDDIDRTTVHAIEITLEAKDSLSTDNYYVMLWNFDTSAWDEVGALMSIGTTEDTFVRNVASGFTSYLNVDREIKVRIANGKALAKGGAPDNDGQLEIDYAIIKVSNWLTGWTYRKQITIDEAKVDADLTNFPVRVSLSPANFDYSKALSTGYDIRFTSSDGSTTIDFEREYWNLGVSSTTEFWVEVPSVASSTASTTFYMYYGNATASDISSSTAVWDANFKGVWHLKETGSNPQIIDSLNVNNSNANTSDPTTLGKIDGAMDFELSNSDYLRFPTSDSLITFTYITWEFWIKPETVGVNQLFLEKYCGVSDVWYQFVLWSSDNIRFLFKSYGGTDGLVTDTTTLTTGTWYYVVATADGTNLKIYINAGTPTSASQNGSATDSSGSVYFSSRGGTVLPFDGIIDEVRVSNSARSVAWIKASYNSGNDTLLTYGSEETETVARRIIIVD